MAENSKIEWTDHTFNPWIGCTKVGPGCDNCYAENMMDHRYHRVQWGSGNPRQRTAPANWRKPVAWNKAAERRRTPARVFCASLADVFDNDVPTEWRDDLWRLIMATPWLNWLMLTKRIGLVRNMLPAAWWDDALNNVWIGATVVTQQEVDRDIPKLMEVPATVRFLSCEPLLEPVDLHLNEFPVDWVIVGGESGPNARPMQTDWCISIAEQCDATGTPFFMKQGSQANWPNWKDFDSWPEFLRCRDYPGMYEGD